MNAEKIMDGLQDIIVYAQEALLYADTLDDDYAFVANINSIIEELGEVVNEAAKHENIRARIGASQLEFKPLQGWDDD